jgi:hypothetical protein
MAARDSEPSVTGRWTQVTRPCLVHSFEVRCQLDYLFSLSSGCALSVRYLHIKHVGMQLRLRLPGVISLMQHFTRDVEPPQSQLATSILTPL